MTPEIENTKTKTKNKPPFLQRWAHAVHRIGTFIGAKLCLIVEWVIRHPRGVIVATIFGSVLLVVVGLQTNFEFETDGNRLWTPANAYTVRNFDWLENDSGFRVTPRYVSMD